MSHRVLSSLDSFGRRWIESAAFLATLLLAIGLPAQAEETRVKLAQLSLPGIRMLSVRLDDPREKEYRAIVPLKERLLGSEHPDTLTARTILAEALDVNGKYAEAEQEYRTVLAIRERLLGSEHPDNLATREKLACSLRNQHNQNKFAEAEQEYRTVIAIRTRVLGAERPDTLLNRNGLAVVMELQNRLAEAEQEYREVLRINERMLDADDREIFASCYRLACCLKSQHRFPEALAFFQRAETGWKKVLGPTAPETELVQQRRFEIQAESEAEKWKWRKSIGVAIGVFLTSGVIAVSLISLLRRKSGSDAYSILF